MTKSGILYLIPTPIGNLADITMRALSTLKDIDLLLCEDTRHTQVLLDHYEIKVKKLSFHEHNWQKRIPEVLTYLSEGLKIGLVSDAGMPVISDPGQQLVSEIRKNKFEVSALPGANAALTALVGSGLKAIPFTFCGFLPRTTQEIKEVLQNNLGKTLIFYESPYRLLKTLATFNEIDSNWQICIGRELTKIHEEYFVGRVEEALAHFKENVIKGEFVIILETEIPIKEVPETKDWQKIINEQVKLGMSPNEAIKKFAKYYKISKKTVYNVYHSLD